MNKLLLIGLCIIILLVPTVSAQVMVNDAEQGFTFDNANISGSNPLDVSGNGNDGTSGAGTTTGQAGIINQGFITGASSFINTGMAMDNVTPTYSMSLWANLTSANQGKIIMGRRTVGDTEREFFLQHSGSTLGELFIQFYNGAKGAAGSLGYASGISDEFVHIVLTRDGNNVNLYVNGVLRDSDPTTGKNVDAGILTEPVVIGANGQSNIQNFNGPVDEWYYYKYVLNASQVSELYNNGTGFQPYNVSAPPTPPPISVNGTDEFYIPSIVHVYLLNDSNYTATNGVKDIIDGTDGQGEGRVFYDATNSGATLSNSTPVASNLEKWGSYYEFDGANDYIQTPLPLDSFNSTTITGWIKVNGVQDYTLPGIVDAQRFGIEYVNSTGRMRVYAYNGVTYPTADSSSTVNDGDWHHFAATYNGLSTAIYIDGVLEDFQSVSLVPNSSVFEIGRTANTGGRYFKGGIDEVRIWNRTLSPQEIYEDLVANAPTQNNKILAYYGFNINTGNLVLDQNQLTYGYREEYYETGSPSQTYIPGTGFDGINDRIVLPTGTIEEMIISEDFTVCTWSNMTSTGTTQYVVSLGGAGLGKVGIVMATNGRVGFQITDLNSEQTSYSTTTHTNKWVSSCYVYQTNNLLGYVNGQVAVNLTSTGINITNTTSTIGSRGSANYFNGSISNVRIYNRSLTASEVNTIYLGLQHKYFIAKDNVTNQTINSYNITTAYGNATTTTGNASLYVPQGDMNVSWVVNNYDARNLVPFTIVNGTLNYDAQFVNSAPSFLISNTILGEGFTLRLARNGYASQYVRNANSTTVSFSGLTNGSYFINFYNSSTLLYNTSVSIGTGSPLYNVSNFGFNEIYFEDGTNSSPLSNSNVSIKYPSGATLSGQTNANGLYRFLSAYNAQLEYGTYNMTFADKIGYETPITFMQSYGSNQIPFNETFAINVTGIIVNIYDVETRNKINVSADVIFTSLFNVSSNNGSVVIGAAAISPGVYTVYVDAVGYYIRQKSFTYSGQDSIELNFYVLQENSTNAGNLFVNVFDEQFYRQVGADTRLLMYDQIAGEYIEISQCYTDSNGECVFLIELGAKKYIVTSTKTIDGRTYQVQSSEQGVFYSVDNTLVELYFSTTTPFTFPDDFGLSIYPKNTELDGNILNISATFIDIYGNLHSVCLEYFYMNGYIKTPVAGGTKECVIGASSGTVAFNTPKILDLNYTYIVDIYTIDQYGNVFKRYATFTYAGENSFSNAYELYMPLLLIGVLVLLLGASFYFGKIEVFAGGMIPVLLGTASLGLTYFKGTTIAVGIVICLLIIYLARVENSSYGT